MRSRASLPSRWRRMSSPDGGGERLERVDRLHPIPHPLLAERDRGDLVGVDRAGEQVRMQLEAPALPFVLHEGPGHDQRREVTDALVVHEGLITVLDLLPAHLV